MHTLTIRPFRVVQYGRGASLTACEFGLAIVGDFSKSGFRSTKWGRDPSLFPILFEYLRGSQYDQFERKLVALFSASRSDHLSDFKIQANLWALSAVHRPHTQANRLTVI